MMKKLTTRSLAVLLSVLMLISAIPFVSSAANIYFTTSDLGTNVSLHNSTLDVYYSQGYDKVPSGAKGEKDQNNPVNVKISWTLNGASASSYTVKLSTNSDMSGAKSYSTSSTSKQFNTLYANTDYFWTVSATVSGTKYTSEVNHFRTEMATPRTIKVSGVKNVRDLGGYITADGSRVKSGLIYRCGRLSDSSGVIEITDDGINTMKNELGIKSEIDVRDTNGNISYSQAAQNYYNFPMITVVEAEESYTGKRNDDILMYENYDSIKKFFNTLGDSSNYPLCFHCSIGTDRTGLLAFCILGYLGVSETDMIRDYLLSNYASIGSKRTQKDICNMYVQRFSRCEGGTLSDKIYNYLTKDVGVSGTALKNMKKLMLETPSDEVLGEAITCEADFLNMTANHDYYLANDITVNSSYAGNFIGCFNGNGHTVTTSAPLFSAFNGQAKNLTINGTINVDGDAGALAISSGRYYVNNVKNMASVTATGAAAGFVVSTTAWCKYVNCINYGTITGGTSAAGFVATCNGDFNVSYCSNRGEIISTSGVAGGIDANMLGGACIEHTFNTATVTGATYAGGINGYADSTTALRNCISCGNLGNITGNYAGGIHGYIHTGAKFTYNSYCYNNANISGTTYAAGISAYSTGSNNTGFAWCYNTGSISGGQCAQIFISADSAPGKDYSNHSLGLSGYTLYYYSTTTAGSSTNIGKSVDASVFATSTALSTLNAGATVYKLEDNQPAIDGYTMAKSYGADHCSIYGHDWSTWNTIKSATCKEAGEQTRQCSYCKKSETQTIAKLAHTPGTPVVINANCTTAGSKTTSCTVCKEVISTETIPALNHNLTAWKVITEATETTTGLQKRNCTRCTYVEEEVIPKLPKGKPKLTIEDKTIMLSPASDISELRYAQGEYTTPTAIKNASGCVTFDSTFVAMFTANDVFSKAMATLETYSIYVKMSDGTEYTYLAELGKTEPVVPPTPSEITAVADGMIISVSGATNITLVRLAKGHYTTGSQIKAADGNKVFTGTTLTPYVNDGVFTYEVDEIGEYTLLVKSDEGDTYLYVTTTASGIVPTATASDLDINLKGLVGVSSVFVGKGDFSTYREIKNNLYTSFSNARLGDKTSYVVTADEPGYYTILIRFTDTTKEELILKVLVDIPVPVFTADGMLLNITNMQNVKSLRRAYGTYTSLQQIKKATGVISYSTKAAKIDSNGNATLQMPTEGTVTVCVQYKNGYVKLFTYEVVKKSPSVELGTNSITFGNLEGFSFVRYAKGTYSTPAAIKAAGATTVSKATNNTVTLNNLTGAYSFLVQYADGSQTIINQTF